MWGKFTKTGLNFPFQRKKLIMIDKIERERQCSHACGHNFVEQQKNEYTIQRLRDAF